MHIAIHHKHDLAVLQQAGLCTPAYTWATQQAGQTSTPRKVTRHQITQSNDTSCASVSWRSPKAQVHAFHALSCMHYYTHGRAPSRPCLGQYQCRATAAKATLQSQDLVQLPLKSIQSHPTAYAPPTPPPPHPPQGLSHCQHIRCHTLPALARWTSQLHGSIYIQLRPSAAQCLPGAEHRWRYSPSIPSCM